MLWTSSLKIQIEHEQLLFHRSACASGNFGDCDFEKARPREAATLNEVAAAFLHFLHQLTMQTTKKKIKTVTFSEQLNSTFGLPDEEDRTGIEISPMTSQEKTEWFFYLIQMRKSCEASIVETRLWYASSRSSESLCW